MNSLSKDRRKFGRRTVLKQAIVMRNFEDLFACIVVDISISGARLHFKRQQVIEDEFMLAIPEEDVLYDCRIIHRQATSVGVTFTRVPRKLSYLKAKLAKQREADPKAHALCKPIVRAD